MEDDPNDPIIAISHEPASEKPPLESHSDWAARQAAKSEEALIDGQTVSVPRKLSFLVAFDFHGNPFAALFLDDPEKVKEQSLFMLRSHNASAVILYVGSYDGGIEALTEYQGMPSGGKK